MSDLASAAGSRAARLANHHALSSALDVLTDDEMQALLATAQLLGVGIGGTVTRLDVQGRSVFSKRIPLTAVESEPEHRGSTADVFGLPPCSHYGIGGPGFGVWREVANHRRTTEWVVAGEADCFPLMHHVRVIPGPPGPISPELADIEAVVAFWGGSPAVRARMEALATAPASVMVFLEDIPQTLSTWLHGQLAANPASADTTLPWVDEALCGVLEVLANKDIVHFDAHFENILTDGHRLYLTDFGLTANAVEFELSPAEAAFVASHRSYDRCYAVHHFVHWLLRDLLGHDKPERDALVADCAATGTAPISLPAGAAAIITRYAPVAVIMTRFLHDLRQVTRKAVYPAAEAETAWAAAAAALPRAR